MENGDASCKSQVCTLIAKRKRCHDSDSDMIFLKHFIEEPVFLKHIFELKTLPRFPLVLSDHTGVV